MWCDAPIHKKTDTRGTWAYHSVNGWYIHTSPKHYQTHVWHIKSTRSKRLSDMVDFKHKRIPNPTVTQADEIMTAIQEVVQTIKGLGGVQHSQETCKLQQLVNGASSILLNAHNTPSAPRVMPNNKHNPTATGKATRTHTRTKNCWATTTIGGKPAQQIT